MERGGTLGRGGLLGVHSQLPVGLQHHGATRRHQRIQHPATEKDLASAKRRANPDVWSLELSI